MLRNGEEVASWFGESEKTKSKAFPEAIKKIFYESQISIKQINEVVISVGPGSYTGLRVGFSIAKGLKMALGINIRSVSLLDALCQEMRPITIAALPFGKSEICWKKKEFTPGSLISQNSVNFSSRCDFLEVIKHLRPDNLILPERLYGEILEIKISSNLKTVRCDENLAKIIGTSKQNLIDQIGGKILYPKPFKVE